MTHTPGVVPGETVGVIGLGLVGGSIARDLVARGVRVMGFDRDAKTLQRAREAGILHGAPDAGLGQLVEADVIVLATPVDEAHAVLRTIAAMALSARLVVDVGSTKAGVVATANALGMSEIFIGSHPLAGDHLSGWGASRARLFEGARVFLCPTVESPSATIAAAVGFWEALGAITECLEARVHDERIAWSSHLPHVVSLALALALRRAGVLRSELGPGGRDVTRLSGSSADVWTPIIRENAVAVTAAMTVAEEELRSLRSLLLAEDAAPLTQRLSEARAWFEVSGEPDVAERAAS